MAQLQKHTSVMHGIIFIIHFCRISTISSHCRKTINSVNVPVFLDTSDTGLQCYYEKILFYYYRATHALRFVEGAEILVCSCFIESVLKYLSGLDIA